MGWSLLLQGWTGLEAKADEELAGLRYLPMGQKYVYTTCIYIHIEPCRVLVSIMLLLAACYLRGLRYQTMGTGVCSWSRVLSHLAHAQDE